jgi:hypothetical protein
MLALQLQFLPNEDELSESSDSSALVFPLLGYFER